MGVPKGPQAVPAPLAWIARAVVCFFVIIGALVFVSFAETKDWKYLVISGSMLGGAALFIFGLERPAHPAASAARALGWCLIAMASLTPTSLLFIPVVIAFLAFPAAAFRPRVRPT
jgi:hypothetical protein